MPTVFREGPYRVFFWAQDRLTEPPHVHVERDDHIAKLWLAPVRIERAGGFGAAELRRIFRLITDNEDRCLEVWNGFGR
jgi:hypothetical protein